ncbi:hypothetical protein GCM10022224_061780 [Nonomuraea antimicrobica]|uniref:CsbD-like n=1 Tax=Nonomuraea antimicrobica TaxID=561173 RepID=A0ABP7CDM8_9ACTN
MSVRWEIDNKVQALKRWVRQRFGRTTGDRRHQVAGEPSPVAGDPEQPDRSLKDALRPPR